MSISNILGYFEKKHKKQVKGKISEAPVIRNINLC